MQPRAIEVIPVIDLKGGEVVRARHGLRECYAPIETKLARGSAPHDIVAGLLTIHPFRTLYVADLDAIEARGSHVQILDALIAAFPAISFWVDAGVRNATEARSWLARNEAAHLVLGSETMQSAAMLADLAALDRVILSLDYRGRNFVGPEELFETPHLWPGRVIVMTLARVGSDAGPDMERLLEIKRHAPNVRLYAAGGLRGGFDLLRLAQQGMGGVLVASALHEGRLTGSDLAAPSQEPATTAK